MEKKDPENGIWNPLPSAHDLAASSTARAIDDVAQLSFVDLAHNLAAGDRFFFGFFYFFPQLGALSEHRRRFALPWPERADRRVEGIWDVLTYCSMFRNLEATRLPLVLFHPLPLPGRAGAGPDWGLANGVSVLDAMDAIFTQLRPHMSFATRPGKLIASAFSAGGGALAELIAKAGDRRREIDAIALFDAEGEERIKRFALNAEHWHALDGHNFHVIRGRHQTFREWPDPLSLTNGALLNADGVRLWPTRGRREYLATRDETESIWLWQFSDKRPRRDHNYLHQWPLQGGELDDGEYKGFLQLVLENMDPGSG